MSLFYFLVTHNILCLVSCQIDIRSLLGHPNLFTSPSKGLDKNNLALLRQQFENGEPYESHAAFGSPVSNFNSVVHNVKSRNGEIEIQQWDQLNPIHKETLMIDRNYPKHRSRWIADYGPSRNHKHAYPQFDEEFLEVDDVHFRSPYRLRRPYRSRQFVVANPPKPNQLLTEPSNESRIGRPAEEDEKNIGEVIEEKIEETLAKNEESIERGDTFEDEKKGDTVKVDEKQVKKKEKNFQKDDEELHEGEVTLDEAKTQTLKRVPGKRKPAKKGKKKKPKKGGKSSKKKNEEDEGTKKKKTKKDDEENYEEDEEDESKKEEEGDEEEDDEEEESLKDIYDEFEEEELDDYINEEKNKKKRSKKKKKNSKKLKRKNKRRKFSEDSDDKLILVEGDLKVAKTIDGNTDNRNGGESGKQSRKNKHDEFDYNNIDNDYHQESHSKYEGEIRCDGYPKNVAPDSYEPQHNIRNSHDNPSNFENVDYLANSGTNNMKSNNWKHSQTNGNQRRNKQGINCSFIKDTPLPNDKINQDGSLHTAPITEDTKRVVHKEEKTWCETEKDEYPTKCSSWKTAGYCETNQATRFLWCRKSCLCKADLQ